jgi:hypothetical protein
MGMIAAREATARAKYSYSGMYCRVSAFEKHTFARFTTVRTAAISKCSVHVSDISYTSCVDCVVTLAVCVSNDVLVCTRDYRSL